ncbi:hypothetical protein BH09PLA1_BH09PLA1_32830 [soil metagenome]
MEMSELSLKELSPKELSLRDLSLGERMVLAAQLAVARHWFNSASATRDENQPLGGADGQRITEDPTE